MNCSASAGISFGDVDLKGVAALEKELIVQTAT
jgi:hypothetical protein